MGVIICKGPHRRWHSRIQPVKDNRWCTSVDVQVADNWHPLPALSQKKRRGGGSSKNIGHVPSSSHRVPAFTCTHALSSIVFLSQYVLGMLRNIIRSCWNVSFLWYILSILTSFCEPYGTVFAGFLARDESKTARDASVHGRACMLVDNDSSAGGHGERFKS